MPNTTMTAVTCPRRNTTVAALLFAALAVGCNRGPAPTDQTVEESGVPVPDSVKDKLLPRKELPAGLFTMDFADGRIDAVYYDFTELRKLRHPNGVDARGVSEAQEIVHNQMGGTAFRMTKGDVEKADPAAPKPLGVNDVARAWIVREPSTSRTYRHVNVEFSRDVDLASYAAQGGYKLGDADGVPYYERSTQGYERGAEGKAFIIPLSPRAAAYMSHAGRYDQVPRAKADFAAITAQIRGAQAPPADLARMLKFASGYPKIRVQLLRQIPGDRMQTAYLVQGQAAANRYNIETLHNPDLLPEVYKVIDKRSAYRDGAENVGWLDPPFLHVFSMFNSDLDY